MDLTPKKTTMVPLTWNWDLNKPIGFATVYENGRIIAEVQIPTNELLILIKRGLLRGLSLGYSFEVLERKESPAKFSSDRMTKDWLRPTNEEYLEELMKDPKDWKLAQPGMKEAKVKEEGFQEKARRLVFAYIADRLERNESVNVRFSPDDVFVVWFSKTLQNWKALISTTLPDGMYYEVTYNGDQHETYIDVYKKFQNIVIVDEREENHG